MLLKDYTFGYAEAEREMNIPHFFEKAFYDSNNMIEQLLFGDKSILLGRKGTGKSAYRAKIQSIAEHDERIFAYPFKLNEFEFSTFSKTSTSKDITGSKKYKDTWDFLLLLQCYQILYNGMGLTEVPELNKRIKVLAELGFPVKDTYKQHVHNIQKLKFQTNIKIFDITFEKEFGFKPSDFLSRMTKLNEFLLDGLACVYLEEKFVRILIDGLDDILRYKKNQLEILSSLIRSTDYLNSYFLTYKIPIKIILFIRDDIFNLITDPDINKTKRDSSLSLSWGNGINDLKEIVNLRFLYSGVLENKIEEHWYDIFPKQIRNKDSWHYILEHTLHKPRDILQFLKICSEKYPNSTNLKYQEINGLLQIYSVEHFMGEMKNELAGFISDEYINALSSVFLRIGDRKFSFSGLKTYFEEQIIGKEINDSDIRLLLKLLYEAGYVGNLVNNMRGQNKHNVIFVYSVINSQIDYSQQFILHRGLYKGLGIKS